MLKAAKKETRLLRIMTSATNAGGISDIFLNPYINIAEGKCPNENAKADKPVAIQKIWFCHLLFKITHEIIHTKKGMKKSLNIISSPIPAAADATIEAGKGGWGRGPR